MSLKTTVIGSYPKPEYLKLPDWFNGTDLTTSFRKCDYTPYAYTEAVTKQEGNIKNAMKDVTKEQQDLGIDIITDGEISRENYIYHFCRHLKGFNFEKLTTTVYRNGACKGNLPTIETDVSPKEEEPWCDKEWLRTQALTDTPVKMTLPGPMTIMGTTANTYYKGRERELSEILAKCINKEVLALEAAGCCHIQIDEPVMVRSPDVARNYGISHLERCFEGIGNNVMKSIHLCCGYPLYFNQKDYPKADAQIYHDLAPLLDDAIFDAVSIEDAHRRNDLSLFDKFKKTTIILGVLKIAEDNVETVGEIMTRVKKVLEHIPCERLMLSPDCGLAMLPKPLLMQKIAIMVQAARELNKNV